MQKLIPHALQLYAGTFSAVFLAFVTGGITPCNAQNAARNSFDQLSNTAQFSFDRWRTAEGLPDNTINDLLQTNDGYLWIGTNGSGLHRYENGLVSSFTMNEGLANIFFTCMVQDTEGSLNRLRKTRMRSLTRRDGLLRSASGVKTVLTTETGLSNNFVSSIVPERPTPS